MNQIKGQFRESWKEEYPWVEYDQEKNAIFCNLCIKAPSVAKTLFNSDGYKGKTNGMRLYDLKSHQSSKSHNDAIQQLSKMSKIEPAMNNSRVAAEKRKR